MSEPGADEHDFAHAMAYDAVVLPRYARPFHELLWRAVQVPARANILDLACRTGETSLRLLAALGEGRIVALDPDASFLELARRRAADDVGRRLFLNHEPLDALRFGNGVFTNVVGALIDRATTERGALLGEAARVLRPHGQLALSLPLRGSFAEVLDLFREVALKHDLPVVGERVEQYALSMPTRESWQTEVESRGFTQATVDAERFVLEFAPGEELLADPALWVAAMPEWRWCAAAADDGDAVLYRVQDTVNTYFHGRRFEVTVIAGCVSARRTR